MRAGILKVSWALALLSLLPGAAQALELDGWAGADYYRRDDVQERRLLDDRLHLDLGLYAAGDLGGPETALWSARGEYASDRTRRPGSTTRQGMLTYSGLLRILDVPTSRLALTAGAARTQTDVTINSTASGGLTGSSVGSAYQGSLTLRAPDRPVLVLGGSWGESTNSGFGRPDNSLTVRIGEANLMHGGSGYNYWARYEIRDQAGTNAPANFRTQRIDLTSQVVLDHDAQAGLSAQHFIRSPGNGSTLNLQMEDTRVRLFGGVGEPSLNLRGQYSYGHSLTRGTPLGDQEGFSQNLAVTGYDEFTPEWALRSSLGLSATELHQGAVETSAAGQTLALSALWRRLGQGRTLGAEIGGRVAHLDPVQGASQVGWGTTLSATYGSEAGGLRYLGTYRLDYDANVDAVQGTDLRQQANLDASAGWTRNLVSKATLYYSASRRHRVLLGDSADRNLSVRTSTAYREYLFGLEVGATDGVTGALGNPIREDGFFLPADFQTHSRFVLASITAPFGDQLGTFASVRYATLSAPEFATQGELTLTASISWRVGQFSFSVEDQYVSAGSSSLDLSVNTLFLRAIRHFGTR